MRGLFLGFFFLLIPGLSLGVLVDAPDLVGVYFDPDANMVSADLSAFGRLEAYLILTNPTQPTVHGYEVGLEFDGPLTPPTVTFPTNAYNFGDPYNQIVVFLTPVITTEATVLSYIDFYYLGSGEGLFIGMGAPYPSSMSGDFPVIVGEDSYQYECNYLGSGMGVNIDAGFPIVVYAPDYSSFNLPVAEDFDDDEADGFTVESGDWSVQDGAYFGLNEVPGTRAISTIGDEGWWNYRANVDVQVDGASNHEILVRYHNSHTGYAITYSCEPEPSCTLHKIILGEEELLLQEAAPALACGPWHTLTVDAVGQNIRALLDGHLLFSYADTNEPIISGKVALVSNPGASAYCNAGFDNLSIVPIQGGAWGTLNPLPADLGSIDCYSPQAVSFWYEPDADDPPVRGYSASFRTSNNVVCDPALFVVHAVPSGQGSYFEVIENGPNDFTIDYTVVGANPAGIAGPAELFTISLVGDTEGPGTVEIYSADFRDMENQNIPVDFAAVTEFMVDCTTPVVVENAVASPQNGAVQLNWEENANPDNFTTVIYRAMYSTAVGVSAYPLYGQDERAYIPERPADMVAASDSPDWILVGTVPAQTLAFCDSVSSRGIYYYEFFSIDPAGGVSPPLSYQVAATNYRLGDVAATHDGLVNGMDITYLGSGYALYAGETGFLPQADVGPATGGSGSGLPLPDGYVGFDDLMIFGLNYGEPAASEKEVHGQDPVVLSWGRDEDGNLECRLMANSAGLKGLRFQLDGGATGEWDCHAGALIEDQANFTFFNVDRKRGLDISLVSLGSGAVIEGTGSLFTLGLENEFAVRTGRWTARDLENQAIEVVVELSGESLLPNRTGLFQNVPNPFNPSTTISFEIPKEQTVSLGIYGVDGKLIRDFGAHYYGAGQHGITWNGTDGAGRRVASGTYFCRMQCEGFDRIIKMALTK